MFEDTKTLESQSSPNLPTSSAWDRLAKISAFPDLGGGVLGKRSRLFFDGMQIVRRARPNYILFENSPEILKAGFEYVLLQLSESGYNAEWQILSGTDFGIQQSRKRLYLIAYSNSFFIQRPTEEKIFSKRILQEQFVRISPGWRTRRDIPEPKNFRSTNDIPNLVDRIKSTGNAIMPVIAKYMFECIKEFERKLNK